MLGVGAIVAVTGTLPMRAIAAGSLDPCQARGGTDVIAVEPSRLQARCLESKAKSRFSRMRRGLIAINHGPAIVDYRHTR